MTVNNENTIIKGLFIDHKENQYSINKCFNNENEAKDFLDNMRERNCEFCIQVNRINWKG
jgi:hypothetical protein